MSNAAAHTCAAAAGFFCHAHTGRYPEYLFPIDTSSARGPLVASHASVAYSHSRRVRLHVRVISRIWAWSGFSTGGE